MATNPWTCLPPLSHTLTRRVTHACAAALLCLGLTGTAATAAGSGDPDLPDIGGINNDEPIKRCHVDDIIWAGGQMIEEAEIVYELVLGNAAQNYSVRPLLVEWAMVGETEVDLSSLVSIGDDELAEGVFMTGSFVGEEDAPWLDFEPTGTAIAFEAFALAFANEQLADLVSEESGLQFVGLAVVRGIATGEAGTLDDVWMLLMEWDSGSGETGGVSMMPIGIGSVADPEQPEEQEVTPQILETIGKICVGGAITMIGVFVGCEIAVAACRTSSRQGRDRCWEKCEQNHPAPPGCYPLWMLDPENEEDAWCHAQWTEHYDCIRCCTDKHRQYRKDCRDTCGVFAPAPDLYDTCWE